MLSLPSQPRINVDRSGEIDLKITLFSSQTLPLTRLAYLRIKLSMTLI